MGLLERILEKIIAEHAGEFLTVNHEQLRVGVMKGEVVLVNVELKPGALDSFELPFQLKSCRVATLRAKIPWNELSSKSVKLTLSGVDVIFSPAPPTTEGVSMADTLKRKRLEAAELLLTEHMEGEGLNTDEADNSSTAPRMTLLQRILSRIADNVQVRVENLRVRFEDMLAKPSYAFELQLTSLTLETVSSMDGMTPQFVDRASSRPPPPLKRRLTISGLTMFWERPPQFRRCLLDPIGMATATITQAEPHLDVKASITDELVFHFDVNIVQDILALTDRASAHDLLLAQNYIRRLRPKQSPKVDPIGWWQYAIRAVRKLVVVAGGSTASTTLLNPVKNTGWTGVIRAMQHRWRYVMLYKRRLIVADGKFQARARRHAPESSASATTTTTTTPSTTSVTLQEEMELARFSQMTMLGVPLSPEEQLLADSVLNELEVELPLTSLMLFRSFAEAEFRQERSRLKKLHRSKRITNRAVNAVVSVSTYSRKALLGRFRRSAGTTTTTTTTPPSAPEQQQQPATSWALDDKEKQLLYERVMSTPETEFLMRSLFTATVQGVPPPFTVDVSMTRIVFRLSAPNPVMDLSFGKIELSLAHRLGTTLVATSSPSSPPTRKRHVIHTEQWVIHGSVASMGLSDLLATAAAKTTNTPISHFSSVVAQQGHGKHLVELDVDFFRPLQTGVQGAPVSSLRAVVDIGPTLVVMTLDLLSRVFALAARANTDRYVSNIAPHTIQMLNIMKTRTANTKFNVPPEIHVKVDWDLPTISIPLPGSTLGDAYEIVLGRCRVRTTSPEEIHMEVHGISVAHVQTIANVSTTLHPVLDAINLDATLAMKQWTARAHVTPDLTLRLPPTVAMVTNLIQTASSLSDLIPKRPPSTTTTIVSSSPLLVLLRRFSITLTVPKVEFVAMIPCSRPGLRIRRKGWGDVDNLQQDLLPEVGQIKLRVGDVSITNTSLTVGSIHLRDDVQRAGTSFRDLFALEEPGLCLSWIVPGLGSSGPPPMSLRVSSPIRLAWNPSTIDAIASFILQSLDRVVLPASLPSPASSPSPPPPLTLSIPELSLSLNQETICARLAVVKLVGLHVSINGGGGVSMRLRDFVINGVQWEPLTSTVGVQLVARGLPGDDDSNLPEDGDDFLTLDVDDATKRVTFIARHVRFLWVHTLTKQVADYVTDGIIGLIPPRHSVKSSTTQDIKPPLIIQGQVHNAVVVVPALRFGSEFRYRRGGNADELQAIASMIGIGVTVRQNTAAANREDETCWRNDEPGASQGDATTTQCISYLDGGIPSLTHKHGTRPSPK